MNWEQLRAILWLRWRLSRNQLARGGKVNAVLSVVFMILMGLASLGFGAGGFILGRFVAVQAPPSVLLLIWDGVIFVFLIFWFSGLMVEIQRSESIDLTKLLHLPVSLSQVFVFNYLASLFSPSLMLFMPGMFGLCLGLAFGAGWLMALLGLVVLSFIFLVTAWTYCLSGWLAALMINKRRRRTVIVGVTMVFVLLAQTPNLFFNSSYFRKHTRRNPTAQPAHARTASAEPFTLPELIVDAHLAVPPGWVGYSAMALRQGSVLVTLASTAVGCLLGGLGLLRAYRLTLRFYQSAETSKPAKAPVQGRAPGVLLVERRLPWLPDETTALAMATLRSLLRAPELKMALLMPVIMGAVMGSMYFTRPKNALSSTLLSFAATAAVALGALSLAPTMSNMFGLDRNGFRTLVLLPTRRHHILLAKNLAFLPLVATATFLLLLLIKVAVGVSWQTFLVGILQVPTAFFLFSLVCNLVSILAPYRLAAATLQAKKPKPIVFVAVFATLLVMPIVLLPLLIPPLLQFVGWSLGWAPWLPIQVLAALGVLAGAVLLYAALLPAQGRLLQRREQIILREVTEDIE